LIKSPAPDENIDRTYRLPVGVAFSPYDDFVEIVVPRPDDSAVPNITDLQIIRTSTTSTVQRICDSDDIIALQPHPKRTRSTVFTVVGRDIGTTSGIL